MLLVIAVYAFVLPFQFAFYVQRHKYSFGGGGWLAQFTTVHLLSNVLYAADSYLRLTRFAYYDEENRQLITDAAAIRRRHLQSTLGLDLIAALPLDTIALPAVYASRDSADGGLQLLFGLRLLKLFSVAYLWRRKPGLESAAPRLLDLASRLQLPLPGSEFLTLMRKSVSLTLAMHWIACLWFYVGTVASAELQVWEQCGEGPCLPSNTTSLPQNSSSWLQYDRTADGIQTADCAVSLQYVRSLYFSFSVATSVGYGDVFPMTHFEQLYVMVAMVVGTLLYVTPVRFESV